MSGSVDVQSSARRSYRAVVMPTDALLTLGMLKLTSLMMNSVRTIAVMEGAFSWLKCFSGLITLDIRLCVNKHMQLAESIEMSVWMAAAFEMRIADGLLM
jgi:hypothetical protein